MYYRHSKNFVQSCSLHACLDCCQVENSYIDHCALHMLLLYEVTLHVVNNIHVIISFAPLAEASSRSPVLLTMEPGLTEVAVGGFLFLSSYRYIQV